MTVGLPKLTLPLLFLGLLVIGLIGWQLGRDSGLGLATGYGLFSLNFIFLSQIYAGLVRVMQTGETSARFKTALMVGTVLKFFGLIAALYALMIVWKLPGLYIAIGSLVSLVLLTTLLVHSYLKSFRTMSAS